MKKCPKCSKTFDDDKRFCQVDGTPLVDDTVEPDDMYKTIVQGSKPFENPSAPQQVSPFSKPAEDDILQIPQADDPMKTIVSPDFKSEPPKPFDLPKAADSDMSAPSFGDLSSGRSEEPQKVDSPFSSPTSGAPASPFDIPSSGAPSPFDPPPPYKQPTFDTPPKPFEQNAFGTNQPIAPVNQDNQWTPPPAPVSDWNNQQIDSNTPFNPPVVGADGQNKTLATVSLILGILSLCCGFITGIAAIITGYMAKQKIKEQPNIYGGDTFALIGMILGAIGTILGILGLILNLGGLFTR